MKTRFLKSVIATSKQTQPPMPWQRGKIRTASIKARKAETPPRRQSA
ncbi:MAG: hypothetical protein N4A53_08970 [Pelagimonas sp.]|jgi:hypothetical protein|nr:hypothetical protein [Pelagimonas sp.]